MKKSSILLSLFLLLFASSCQKEAAQQPSSSDAQNATVSQNANSPDELEVAPVPHNDAPSPADETQQPDHATHDAPLQTPQPSQDDPTPDTPQLAIIQPHGLDYYITANIRPYSKHHSLKELSHNKNESLFEDWLTDRNFKDILLPYTKDNYSYSVSSDSTSPTPHILEIKDHNDGKLYRYDLSHLCIQDANNLTGNLEIRYAVIANNALYVSFAHRTYANTNPNTGYLVCIDRNTNELIWQTEPQTANAHTFIIDGNAIYTGYGFTNEPDYLYILDALTGVRVKSIKLTSSPQVIVKDRAKLYVKTQNTEYVYKID